MSDITRDQLKINQIKNEMEKWNYENTRWSINSNGDFDPYKYQNRSVKKGELKKSTLILRY